MSLNSNDVTLIQFIFSRNQRLKISTFLNKNSLWNCLSFKAYLKCTIIICSYACVFKPTQHFDKLLHVEIERVNDGTSGLVVIVIDGDGGETTSNLPLLKHVHLDLGPKVLP